VIDEILPRHLRAIVEEAAARLQSGSDDLKAQAAAARVTASSPTYIDLQVSDAAPRGPWDDGPLDVSPSVVNADGELIGGILI